MRGRWMTVGAALCALANGPGMAAEDSAAAPDLLLSLTPVYQGDADLHTGGDFSTRGAILRVLTTEPVGQGNLLTLDFGYDKTDYRFGKTAALGKAPPWTNVQHEGIGASLWHPTVGSWGLIMGANIGASRENDARWRDALAYGGMVAAVTQLDSRRRIGFGLSLAGDLGRVLAFPLVIIDWQLTEHLRIVNPPPGGIADGSGVELDYGANPWAVGFGSTYSLQRFRLRRHGPIPGGIGEQRHEIAYAHLQYTANPRASVDLFAGGAVEGRVRTEDAAGHLLAEAKVGAAPVAGLTMSVRF